MRSATHDLHSAVPGAGAETVFCDEIPVHGVDLTLVLLPRLHGELVEADVEELHRAVAARRHELVLVQLRPRQIVQRVLRFKPTSCQRAVLLGVFPIEHIPFLCDYALRRQPQDVKPAVPNEAEVGGRGDSDARVEERGVLDSIAAKALGPELEHCTDRIVKMEQIRCSHETAEEVT